MSEFGDFDSDDPFERYNAHQRAKGRATIHPELWDNRDKTDDSQLGRPTMGDHEDEQRRERAYGDAAHLRAMQMGSLPPDLDE